MSEFIPFVKCDHPVTIKLHGVKQLVPCGSCPICEQQKRTALSNLLQVEETHSNFCNFITLTYDDEHLPTYDCSSILDANVGEIVELTPSNFRIIWDMQKSFRQLNPIVKVTEDLKKSLLAYNAHRDLYLNSYSVTKARYEHNQVAVLYYRDIQLFLKRLRKYIKSNYNEEIRYYVVGEYGTNSLRPHWHLLLFYNSFDLFADFQDVEQLGTVKRPSECAKFIHKMWKYGICQSAETDGNAYYYVSGYVNGTSKLPLLLKVLSKPKAYHSIFLGTFHTQKDIKRCLEQKDYQNIAKARVVNKDCTVHTLTPWRSVLSRLFPTFSGCDFKDIRLLFDQLTIYQRLCDGGFKNFSVSQLAHWIFHAYDGTRYVDSLAFNHAVDVCSLQCESCRHADLSVLSPLTSLLYASKRFCQNACDLGYSLREYFNLYIDYYNWYELFKVNSLFSRLEDNPSSVSVYYSSLIDNAVDTAAYRTWYDKQLSDIDKNIKHRSIADRYKYLQ